MSSKPPVHTVPMGNKWTNLRAGSTRAGKKYDTKAEAKAAGRRTAMRDKVEHLIHKKDGTIGESNSYGNDPNPSKG
jgi:hypothetical protein